MNNRDLKESTKVGRFLFAEEYSLKAAEFWEDVVFADEQRFM